MSRLPLALRWLPSMVMMALIFTFSSLPASVLPDLGVLDVIAKKGGHVLGYGLLGLAYFYALPPRLSYGYRWLLALLMAVLFALSDEYHQSFVEGRGSTITDVMIDAAGASLALVFGTPYLSNSSSNSNS
ncbi:MAG: VanZ family protein [Chloroflexota bacterium]